MKYTDKTTSPSPTLGAVINIPLTRSPRSSPTVRLPHDVRRVSELAGNIAAHGVKQASETQMSVAEEAA